MRDPDIAYTGRVRARTSERAREKERKNKIEIRTQRARVARKVSPRLLLDHGATLP